MSPRCTCSRRLVALQRRRRRAFRFGPKLRKNAPQHLNPGRERKPVRVNRCAQVCRRSIFRPGLTRRCLTTAASSQSSRADRALEVTLEIVPEMQHVFQFLAGTAPEGDAAIHRLADWVRPELGLA